MERSCRNCAKSKAIEIVIRQVTFIPLSIGDEEESRNDSRTLYFCLAGPPGILKSAIDSIEFGNACSPDGYTYVIKGRKALKQYGRYPDVTDSAPCLLWEIRE